MRSSDPRRRTPDSTRAQPYIDTFYSRDTDGFHVKTLAHAFKVTGLKQSSLHAFYVRAVYADGSLSAPSATITQHMASQRTGPCSPTRTAT